MPNQIQKSIQGYIAKIKKRNPENENRTTPKSLSASTSWILRGCKYPRTTSFRADHYQNSYQIEENPNSDHVGQATLTDVDHFLHENFKTTYENEGDNPVKLPDFSGSRISVPPAASSSSLIEEAAGGSTGITNHQEHDERGHQISSDDFITVIKNSDNLYEDFSKSMQEMVDARVQQNGKINWEFMEELLICYLNLNDKKSHRYILGAFVDLVEHLRGENQGGGHVPAEPHSVPSSSKGKEKM